MKTVKKTCTADIEILKLFERSKPKGKKQISFTRKKNLFLSKYYIRIEKTTDCVYFVLKKHTAQKIDNN